MYLAPSYLSGLIQTLFLGQKYSYEQFRYGEKIADKMYGRERRKKMAKIDIIRLYKKHVDEKEQFWARRRADQLARKRWRAAMKAAHAKKTKPLLPVDGKSSRA
jgi:hypothetical protein